MNRGGVEVAVTEGLLRHGMPYLAFGSGRPLVFLRWFTPDHANPTGRMRSSELKKLAGLARRFRVYTVGRAPGTVAGATMADPLVRPKVPADTHHFLMAEDGFDLTGRLGEITMPTLIVGGDRDGSYSTETLRCTADGIPAARLILYPRTGHLGAASHPHFVDDVVRFLGDSML